MKLHGRSHANRRVARLLTGQSEEPGWERRVGSHVTVDPSGCWFYKDPDKYSMITINGVSRLAHRWFFEYFMGPIPSDVHLHHTCERKGCVNVDHLVPMTGVEHFREHNRLRHRRRLEERGVIKK